jgi:ABC-type multidrug transport system ATPase subunit
MNIIETQALSRSFKRVDAVRDLELTVPQGSMFALIGPNGAGKTTTIKLLMNLVQPSLRGPSASGSSRGSATSPRTSSCPTG